VCGGSGFVVVELLSSVRVFKSLRCRLFLSISSSFFLEDRAWHSSTAELSVLCLSLFKSLSLLSYWGPIFSADSSPPPSDSVLMDSLLDGTSCVFSPALPDFSALPVETAFCESSDNAFLYVYYSPLLDAFCQSFSQVWSSKNPLKFLSLEGRQSLP